jgi:hypothetical protein
LLADGFKGAADFARAQMSGIDLIESLLPNATNADKAQAEGDKAVQAAQDAWDAANKAAYDAGEERKRILADLQKAETQYNRDLAAADPEDRGAITRKYKEERQALEKELAAADKARETAFYERDQAGVGLGEARDQAAADLAAAQAKDAELQAVADQAMADLQAAQAQAQTLATPEEQARFFQLRQKQIAEEAKLKQDLINATTDAERARIEEKLALLAFAQQQETALYEAEAQARVAAYEDDLALAEDSLKTLGDLVYYSQEDFFGQGQESIKALVAGMQAQLAQAKTILSGPLEDLFASVGTVPGLTTSDLAPSGAATQSAPQGGNAPSAAMPSGDTYNIYITVPNGQPATADIQRLVTDAVAAALRQAARQGDIRNRTGG